MIDRDKTAALAVSLTIALGLAIAADAVLASASWQSPVAAPARVPARVPAPSPVLAPVRPAPGPIAAPPPRILHVRAGEMETTHITREAARRVVRRAIPALEGCYETARRERADLEGRVVTHVSVQLGFVQTQMMTTTTGEDTSLEQCVANVLAYGAWPQVSHRAEVVVPLVFDTTAE